MIRAGVFGEPLLPDYLTGTERVRYQAAGEARLRGGGDLLALGRAEDTSRHVLAVLQPLEAGEVVRVQWLITGARAPRQGGAQSRFAWSEAVFEPRGRSDAMG